MTEHTTADDPAVVAARTVLALRRDDIDAAAHALSNSRHPHLVALALAQLVADRVSVAEAYVLVALHIAAATRTQPPAPTPPAAPPRVPVRAAGMTTHWVRRTGLHEHHHYVVADGRRVEVTRWPKHAYLNAHIRVWDQAGELVTEETDSGLMGVGAILRLRGFEPSTE